VTDPKGYVSGCANCGRELHHTIDQRGERWMHKVEPTGHESLPDDLVRLGRARAIEEVRRQFLHGRDNGDELTWEWIDDWLDYFSDADVLTSAEEDNAAYRDAMAAMTS